MARLQLRKCDGRVETPVETSGQVSDQRDDSVWTKEPMYLHNLSHQYINLRSARGVFIRGGRAYGRSPFVAAVGFIQFALASFYADCPRKPII